MAIRHRSNYFEFGLKQTDSSIANLFVVICQ
jgi:hypothetical protein